MKYNSWFNTPNNYWNNTLVWDIETTSKDASKAKFKVFGAYSYKYKQYYITTNVQLMKRLLMEHPVYITYNGKEYDIPVLRNNFSDFDEVFKYKTHLDMLEMLKPRALRGETRKGGKGRTAIIGECRLNGLKDDRFPNLALGTVIKHIHKVFDVESKGIQKEGGWIHENKMEDFDYNIFKDDKLLKENWDLAQKYLKADLVITRELFEFFDAYFAGFKESLSSKQVNKLHHLTTSTGSFAYKSFCNELGLEEEYSDDRTEDDETFEGAFVQRPTRDSWGPEDGDGYCVDFASQHPHNQWSANLFTPVEECPQGKCPKPYSGDGTVFNLAGTYCGCTMGRKEKWLRSKFFLRVDQKRKFIQPSGKHVKFKNATVGLEIIYIDADDGWNLKTQVLTQAMVDKAKELAVRGVDPREYTTKIIINSSYGISSSKAFKNIYRKYTGEDTTTMSRQSTEFMKQHFEKNGYNIAYGDTDSLYMFDPFKDKDKMKRVMAEGIQMIRDALPFSDVSYNMDIDAEIDNMWYFGDYPKTKRDMTKLLNKDIELEYRKKNYVYITKEKKIKLMGLPIIKMDATKISKKIFQEYLAPTILDDREIKFDKEYLQQLVEIELKEDIFIAGVFKNCNDYNSYVLKHEKSMKKAAEKKLQQVLDTGQQVGNKAEFIRQFIKEKSDEPTGLQAKIAKQFGEGKHFMVKNNKYGIPSSAGDVFFANVKDADGKLTADGISIKNNPLCIDLSKTWSELEPFMKTDELYIEFRDRYKIKVEDSKQLSLFDVIEQ